MIEIRRLDKTIDATKYDEVWMIVRSYKNPSPNIRHVPELSPPPSLFRQYLNLAKNGQWNQKTFESVYVPQFLADLHGSPEGRAKLNELYKLDKAGRRICLLCYCADGRTCHRSIIAGLLQGVGCNVVTVSGEDYRKYYERWREM